MFRGPILSAMRTPSALQPHFVDFDQLHQWEIFMKLHKNVHSGLFQFEYITCMWKIWELKIEVN